MKVLFIGNSFTYRNGVVEFSSGVPGLFDGIAEDLGFAVETYSITGPGWYLESHANPSDRCGRQVDKLLSACDDFDYIVLQDQSTCPYRENARFLNGVGSMLEKIESTQTHAEVYLYETWGSPFSSAEDGTTIAEMESKLRSAYTAAGGQFGLHVTYVGAAFTDAYYNGGIYLWDTDNRHQGFAGAYLSAATHVGSMLGADVRETAFTGEGLYDAPALGEETLTALREAAYRAASGELAVIDEGEQGPDGGEDEEQAQILKIACWGRFMKEEKFRRLVDGFETYAKQTGSNTARSRRPITRARRRAILTITSPTSPRRSIGTATPTSSCRARPTSTPTRRPSPPSNLCPSTSTARPTARSPRSTTTR